MKGSAGNGFDDLFCGSPHIIGNPRFKTDFYNPIGIKEGEVVVDAFLNHRINKGITPYYIESARIQCGVYGVDINYVSRLYIDV